MSAQPTAQPGGGPVDAAGGLVANDARARAEMREIIARYPQPRSALLPMLHLVQAYDGYVTPAGIEMCASELGLTEAEVTAVATFYTMYKRHPMGDYHVGVCTNTLCAVLGGDAIWAAVSEHLGVGHDETTDDGRVSLERVECNAACDYAPVVMVNWEFFDNQTTASAVDVVDRLRAGEQVASTRGPLVCTFRQAERVLAGFPDGLATEGPTAGEASLRGLRLVRDAEAQGERRDDLAEPVEPIEHHTAPSGPAAVRSRPSPGRATPQAAEDVQRQGQARSGSEAPQQTAESDTAHPSAPGHQDSQPEADHQGDVGPRDVQPKGTGEQP